MRRSVQFQRLALHRTDRMLHESRQLYDGCRLLWWLRMLFEPMRPDARANADTHAADTNAIADAHSHANAHTHAVHSTNDIRRPLELSARLHKTVDRNINDHRHHNNRADMRCWRIGASRRNVHQF